MIRLAWFVVGAVVATLLRRRDDLEDRLGELEAEADARRDAAEPLCPDCWARKVAAVREGKPGFVVCDACAR